MYTHAQDNACVLVLPLSVVFTQNSTKAPDPAHTRSRNSWPAPPPASPVAAQLRFLGARSFSSDVSVAAFSRALAPEDGIFGFSAVHLAGASPRLRRPLFAVLPFLIATPPRLEFPVTRRKQKAILILIATRIRLWKASLSILRPARLPFIFAVFAVLAALVSLGALRLEASTPVRREPPSAHRAAEAPAIQNAGVPELFAEGEAALRAGQLDRAEADFKKVLAADPNSAGAYANLGVIAMRKQEWQHALDLLRKADQLAPTVRGYPVEHRPGLLPAE